MKNKSKGISLNWMSKTYDLITPIEGSKFRQNQIRLLDLKERESVLDVGCGTGSLTMTAKRAVDSVNIIGIDIAPKMVKRAKEKAEKQKMDIQFKAASIDKLPFKNESFDIVISSLMMHHLPVRMKITGLKEIYRVLKKGGRFLLSDWGRPNYIIGYIMVLSHIWMESTRTQLFGRLPDYIKKAGFKNIKLVKKGAFMEHYLAYKD